MLSKSFIRVRIQGLLELLEAAYADKDAIERVLPDILDPHKIDRLQRNLENHNELIEQWEAELESFKARWGDNEPIEYVPLSSTSPLYIKFSQAYTIEDWDTTIDLGEQLLKVDEDDEFICNITARAYRFRGEITEAKSNLNQALADLSRSIELQQNTFTYEVECREKAFTYYVRSDIYRKLNQYQKAIDDCNQALKLYPRLNYCYTILGLIHRDMNDKVTARRFLQQAAELGDKEAIEELKNWAD